MENPLTLNNTRCRAVLELVLTEDYKIINNIGV